MTQLSKYLKECRLEHEMSQRQVAELLRIDRSTYSYYEAGRYIPPIPILLRLSKLFNVPYLRLFEIINEDLGIDAVVD